MATDIFVPGERWREPIIEPMTTAWVNWSDSTTTSTATSATWREWTCTSATNITPSITDTSTWYHWTTASTTTTSDRIWTTWYESDAHRHAQTVTQRIQHAQAERAMHERLRVTSPEEARRQAEQIRQTQIQRELDQKKRNEERALARKRAEELLIRELDDVQRLSLKECGFFFVNAPSGVRYRIRKGREGNVDKMHSQEDRPHSKLCIHPRAYVPDYDTMLAQKLMIEHDEREFLRIANETIIRN